jgi:epoxyqueuosine reductase QueG
MTTSELEKFIHENCGDPAVGITSMDDFTPQEIKNMEESNRTMAAYTPLISADMPVLNPQEFMDGARAIIMVGYNAFFGREHELPGKAPHGEIINAFVNQECIDYNASQNDKIIAFLEKHGFSGLLMPAGIPQKILSARSGLGRYGKNALIQTPGKGSWLSLYAIFTDAPLDPDQPIADMCGDCDECKKACPTGAINEPYTCDIERCLTMQAMYNKGVIPLELREKMGSCIAECCICMDACPQNKNLTVNTDVSNPLHLVHPEIAPLVNMTDAEFEKLFGGSFFEFLIIEKKHLQRNAAIALGNHGDPDHVAILIEALETQDDELVRGAAAWALGKIATPDARAALEKSLKQDTSESVRSEIQGALDRLQKH